MNIFSASGLIFDIIGVLFVFCYGLPSKFNSPESLFGKDLILDESDKLEISKNYRIKNKAYIGLIFILLGFILQLVGVICP